MSRTYIITIDEEGTYIETPHDKIVHIIGKEVITTYDSGHIQSEMFCQPSSAKIQGFYLAGIYS